MNRIQARRRYKAAFRQFIAQQKKKHEKAQLMNAAFQEIVTSMFRGEDAPVATKPVTH